MKTEKIDGKVVEIYETIDELPIKNYIAFNKYYLIDANIGSDIGDFDRHLATLIEFIETDNKEKAVQLINNMKQLFWFISHEVNPMHMSWACFVHSIDGKKCKDLTPNGLKKVLNDINK